ncbi:MAG TPA: PQQ-binding-like beta-propeller repeat protein [Longimicrobiales bacterium]
MRGKLGRCLRSVNSAAALLLVLSTAGCLRPPHAVTRIDSFVWSGTLRDATRTPYIAERTASDPAIQWEQRIGRGYTDVPAVQGELLLATSTAKTMTVVNAETGRRYWEHRTNGPVIGGLTRLDDRVYAATQSRDGRVEAFTLARGRHLWTFRMHSPATAGALLLDSVLYVGSQRGDLFALHIDGPKQLWLTRLPSALAAPVVSFGGDLYALTARDSLLAVDRESGRMRGGVKMAGSASAPFALQGDRLIVPVHPGLVQAVRLPDMRIEWTAQLDAPILAAPALDSDGTFFLLSRIGDVWHVDAGGGATRIARLGNAATGSLTLTADGILAGMLDGTLIMLRRDGTEIWRRKFDHSLQTPVAVKDGAIYVPLADGHMVMLR